MGKVVRPDDRKFVEHVLVAREEYCGVCKRRLWITQWRERSLERLDGLHILTMKDKRCPDGECPGRGRIHRPPEELAFGLKWDLLGLDVLFEIGERRLQDDMTFEQIHRRLRNRGVPICLKTVSNAFERFLALVSCRSGESDEVKVKLRAQGGIVLLVDGVQFDDHSPVLYIVSDAISHETLFAERHEVRSAKALEALLQRVKAMNVEVLAVVSDKEKGLVPAIRAVFPKAPHQYCQLHYIKRCAAPLKKPLAQLASEIKNVGDEVRALKRKLKQAQPAASEAEAAERKVAEGLLTAAHAASKVSGRAPFAPPALKRHERLLAVRNAADRAAKKGALVASLSKSRRR